MGTMLLGNSSTAERFDLQLVSSGPSASVFPSVSTSAPRLKSEERPPKPYPDFPLFPHRTKRWAKKIRGKFQFFGPWNDPHGALDRYVAQRDALHGGLGPSALPPAMTRPSNPPRAARAGVSLQTSGPSPRPAPQAIVLAPSEGPTLRDLANHFLTFKRRRVDSKELTLRAFSDYHRILGRLLECVGAHRAVEELTPGDFAAFRDRLAKTRGPLALSADITKVKTLFKYAEAEGLIERIPRYGPGFEKPSRKQVRTARARAGERMFEKDEIKKLLDAAPAHLRAMVLLGLNGGMGNTDIATLPISAVDLDKAVIEFPRPKTGVARKTPLWPETVEALRAVLAQRSKPKDDAVRDLVFLTKYGKPWVRIEIASSESTARPTVQVDSITLEFGKLMRAVGVYRPRRGFYALRHTFRTVADEVGDRRAIDLIMGHENGNDISTHYVERVGDERLRRVVEHVRAWAFALTAHAAVESQQS